MKKICYVLCIACLLVGCADNKKMAPKEGRIAVQPRISSQIEKTQTAVQLKTPAAHIQWTQPSANAANRTPHGKIKSNADEVWSCNVGKGLSSNYHYLPEPIIVNNTIYTLDGAFQLTATDEKTGHRKWQQKLPTPKEMSMASIGLTSDGKQLYAVNGNGMVYAIDLTGKIVWEHDTNAILRSAPTVSNGFVYIVSGNNELFALRATDGSEAWRYKNMATDTNLFGMGQPAVRDNIIVVPFSSGEIVAFDAKSGMILWSDTLLSYRTFNQINDLSHVLASPVIEGNTVYLIGNAKKTGAYHLKTGAVQFVQNIGGQNTPVINGNALFMITTHNTLAALDKKTGELIWETPLTSKEAKNIAWNGPVLANNQLLTVSNKGDILFVDALTGETKQHLTTEPLSNKPVLGENKIILFTNKANLIAYQ